MTDKYVGREPEDCIHELVESGEIGEAARESVQKQLAMGLTVTYSENGLVKKLHPDGTIEEVSRA